jgi:hypothetical protein
MSLNKLFSFLFLLVSIHVHGQSVPDGYIDTVKVKYDKKKGTLTVKRKDFTTKSFTFKVKSIKDSLQVTPDDMDSLLKVINRFSANKLISNDELLQKLHDTTSELRFIFKRAASPQPGPTGGTTIEDELNEQLVVKEEQIRCLKFIIAGLLLMSLILLVMNIMTASSKRKIQRKQQQDLKDELLGMLNKHFEKGILHIERRNGSADELVAQLAQKHKELKEKLQTLEGSLEDTHQKLSEKDVKLTEYVQKVENHKQELKKLEDKFNVVIDGEKERISLLCLKMIERKDLFVNSLYKLDENHAKKELVRFSIEYSEMAVAVLDEIRGKNNESGKLNIRLLNGSKENFGKTFDQHSPEDAIDREYILMAKIFSDIGIESIEDVYFNGNKFQQKK